MGLAILHELKQALYSYLSSCWLCQAPAGFRRLLLALEGSCKVLPAPAETGCTLWLLPAPSIAPAGSLFFFELLQAPPGSCQLPGAPASSQEFLPAPRSSCHLMEATVSSCGLLQASGGSCQLLQVPGSSCEFLGAPAGSCKLLWAPASSCQLL